MKIYCNVSNKYRKLKNTKILHISKKILSFFIVYCERGHEYVKILKG